MVPDVLVSGRADLASEIGWALEAKAAGWGYRRTPHSFGCRRTRQRGWLRRAAAAAADPSGGDPLAGGVFVTNVAAAKLAGEAYGSQSREPVQAWRHAVLATGGRLLGRPAQSASAARCGWSGKLLYCRLRTVRG